MKPEDRGKLLFLLDARLSVEDVKDLCFVLKLDWDNVGVETSTKRGRLRSLIEHFERRNELPILIAAIAERRMDIARDDSNFKNLIERLIGSKPDRLINDEDRRILKQVSRSLLINRRRCFSLRPYSLPRPKVIIFWHDSGLTKADALDLVGFLDGIGAEGVIAEHIRQTSPDAIFVSRTAGVYLVRSIVERLKYDIKYIFPVDYPDAECGALSPYVMSIGLHSSTDAGIRPKEGEPIAVSTEQMNWLISPGLTENEFIHRLIILASHKSQSKEM